MHSSASEFRSLLLLEKMKFLFILMLHVAIAAAVLPRIAKESKDGQFYLIVDQSSPKLLNWMKAEQECQARGDHLASIHNVNEAAVVGALCDAGKKDRDGEIS